MKKRRRMSLSARHNLIGLLFVLPWIIGFLVFFAYPLVQSINYSMNKVVFTAKGRNMNFVGIDNFRDIFTNYRDSVESENQMQRAVPYIVFPSDHRSQRTGAGDADGYRSHYHSAD